MAWIPVSKPSESSVLIMTQNAAPFGLLMAITQPSQAPSLMTGWGNIAEPTIASWVGVTKPTSSLWTGVAKPAIATWANVPKPISSVWTSVSKPI